MAINDLAPGFLLIHYTSSFGDHKMVLPTGEAVYNSGTVTWDLPQKDGGSIAYGDAVTDIVNVLRPNLPSTSEFTYAELFSKAVGESPVYLSTHSINVVGTNAGAVVKASQVVWSYRDDNGGFGRVVLVDQSRQVNLKGGPTTWLDAAGAGVAAYLVDASCVIKSRNGAFIINVPKILTKTNDALRKKYGMI